jgi:hypothetical protein
VCRPKGRIDDDSKAVFVVNDPAGDEAGGVPALLHETENKAVRKMTSAPYFDFIVSSLVVARQIVIEKGGSPL